MARYVRTDPIEVPTVMHAHEISTNSDGFRALVNANAGAHVATLQNIVKSPWIDYVANEERLYVFQQDSTPSHKALKTQSWIVGNSRPYVTPN
ncbi:hypothetical protein ACTXT7_012817 [Hymenolepis weldensis]